MPLAEQDPRVPTFTYKPYLPRHRKIYNTVTSNTVSATTVAGGYPEIGTTPLGRQSYTEIKNTLAMQVALKGKLELKDAKVSAGEPDSDSITEDTIKSLIERLAKEFGNIKNPKSDKYRAILEYWSIHDALVSVHNLGIDASMARARGAYAEADRIQHKIEAFLCDVVFEIDCIIAHLEGFHDQPQFQKGNVGLADQPDLKNEEYKRTEIDRLKEIRKLFAVRPPTLLVDAVQGTAGVFQKRMHYHRLDEQQRLNVWKKAEFFKDFVVLFLEIVIGPVEIGKTIRNPRYQAMILTQIAKFCDAAIGMVIAPTMVKSAWMTEGNNVFLRDASRHLGEPDLASFRRRHQDFLRWWNDYCNTFGKQNLKILGIEVFQVVPGTRGKKLVRAKNALGRLADISQSTSIEGAGAIPANEQYF